VNEDKSSRYHRLQRRGSVLAVAVSAAVPALFLVTGASAALRDFAVSTTGGSIGGPATVGVFAIVFALLQETIVLPLAFYRSFLLERRYGLSSERFVAWFGDHLKAAGLGLVMFVVAAQAVFFTLNAWPQWWWLASAAVFVAAIAVLARLAPLVLLPMFYTLVPLERESLRARLEALSTQAGVPVLGVYEWGLGARTRRANAALVGMGRTRRILVSDTLLAEYSDDEIEVILAHELAHHVHRDITKGLGVECLLLFAAFAAAGAALRVWGPSVGLTAAMDVAGLPLLTLVGGGVMVAAMPLVHALSRANERRADRYALDITRRPAAFISAMRRLAAQNLAEERPSRIALWLFHSHPPIAERIEDARKLVSTVTS
jgi:STE24 endopeptidase